MRPRQGGMEIRQPWNQGTKWINISRKRGFKVSPTPSRPVGLAIREPRRHGALARWERWVQGNLAPRRNAGQGNGGSRRPPVARRRAGEGGGPDVFADPKTSPPRRQDGTTAKAPSRPRRMGLDANWKQGAVKTGRQVAKVPRRPFGLATWNLGAMEPGNNGNVDALKVKDQRAKSAMLRHRQGSLRSRSTARLGVKAARRLGGCWRLPNGFHGPGCNMQNCRLDDLDPRFHARAWLMSKCRRRFAAKAQAPDFGMGGSSRRSGASRRPRLASGGPKGRGRGGRSVFEIRARGATRAPFGK